MRWLGFAPLLGMAPLSGLTPLLGLAPLLGSAALAPADDPQASSATRPASRPESSAIPVPIRRVLMERNGVSVVNGGFGSSMARDPRDKDQFYFPTDRGPNVDGVGGAKVFVVPNYTPTIGKYRLEGGALRPLGFIELKGPDGKNRTGLPRPQGSAGTQEKAIDADGKPVPNDPDGIDPEGLAAMADGTFWVSEEYGPDLIRFDADGKTLERIAPGDEGRALPRVLARRRPNRGLEALTAAAGGKKLVTVLQSPLDNPDLSPRKTSRAVRIVELDLADGKSQQYVYLLEKPGHSVHEIAALDARRFLVIESDGKAPGDPDAPSKLKKIFIIDLAGATDVSDPKNREGGIEFDGKTLEELSAEELAKAGVRAVGKREALDLLAAGYPHEKPEGMCVIDPDTIAVVNDDDFGIASDGKGGFVGKVLFDAARTPDRSTLRFFRLRL